ncbi:MAG TPA: tRNA (adenosine(37)-N6)-threonylcarbamoyltransferase complex dimerization subunit type 1 TsaB [Gemmatimonadaceae bacterium]|nr:tRNA (adenosine(37)-N6)-threonylcarbamoyltransferase complex dimerization subunit type 1 TsaB [Gemmatimonadaceae bacterium]
MSSSRCTLAIEGATYQGSVALICDGAVVCERTLHAEDGGAPRAGRGERLMPAIAECLEAAGIRDDRAAIERIVCGAGPGSFTSLRVAGSVAKGLAAGYGVPLYSVSSLALSAIGAKPPLLSGEYLALLDAMRGEFFAARITFDGSGSVEIGPATLVSKDELEDLRARAPAVRLVGAGQEIDAHPHARGVARILDAILAPGPVDLASWEPDYGRLAEAQVRWEAAHGRPLAT